MKLTRALDPVLGSTTKLQLLRTLFASRGRTWTGRELARVSRVSTAQTARDLDDLSDVGLVLREVKGKSYSWQVNPEHVLSGPLASLLIYEAGLKSQLLREVRQATGRAPIERAYLFGSVARGEERADSDVDLFVQVKDEAGKRRIQEAVDRIRTRVWNKFGNPVSFLVYTDIEIKRLSNPALVESIEHEGIAWETREKAGRGTD